jgi:3'(2'), 5'-bisphosphate nucleotidase
MSSAALETMIAIAAEAAKVVLDVYRTPFRVDYKGPLDPVTEADRLANELICRRLAREFPGVPIVAEESQPQDFSDFRGAERVFFVDPVDGTNEFVDRNGEFVVMIGLLEGDRATAGVVHAPELGQVWAGSAGEGAFQIDRDGSRRPIRVSPVNELSRARIVSSRSHRSSALEQTLARLGAAQTLVLGSAGLKGMLVARGGAEAYVAPGYAGKRWDACAVDAIVIAAGGAFSDARGAPIAYRGEKLSNDLGVVASNGAVHQSILERLAAS